MKPRHPIEMKITLGEDGNLRVESSQLNDLIVCLGILENAKLAVISHNVEMKLKRAQGQTIVSPTATDLLRRGKI